MKSREMYQEAARKKIDELDSDQSKKVIFEANGIWAYIIICFLIVSLGVGIGFIIGKILDHAL